MASGTRKAQAVSEVSIKKTENGGCIVRCSFDNDNAGPSYQSPKEYAFGDMQKGMAHAGKMLGMDADGDED